MTSEVAIPLRAGRVTIGVFNMDAERPLPDGMLKLLRPLVAALAPRAEAFRASGILDLPGLARLFVYLGSLRDPSEIAALAAASLARVLRVETSQVWIWDEVGPPVELASRRSDGSERPGVSVEELEATRAFVDPSVVCQIVDPRGAKGRKATRRPVVWFPLRANGEEIGALVGTGGAEQVDPAAWTRQPFSPRTRRHPSTPQLRFSGSDRAR